MRKLATFAAVLHLALIAEIPARAQFVGIPTTVAQLPDCTPGRHGRIWVVRDAVGNGDCSVGGGTDASMCLCSAEGFVPIIASSTPAANSLTESMLKAVDAAGDEECLTYESTVGDFEWQTCGSAGIGGSTGATDDAIIIADGVGGATLQSSAATLTTAGSLTIPSAEAIKFSTDTGLVRSAAGVLKVTDGSTGSGAVEAASIRGNTANDYLRVLRSDDKLTQRFFDFDDNLYGGWNGSREAGIAFSTASVKAVDSTGSSFIFEAKGFVSGSDVKVGYDTAGGAMDVRNSGTIVWSSTSDIYGSKDTGLARSAPGVIRSTDGSTGISGFLGGGAAVASATALPVPTGRVFHVTGTTAVTSITSTNFKSGACITIIFDDALTFTDGSNLKLAGNFVTTADDTISLCYDGTNWFETARSVN